jgi:hypothetical protein
MFCPSCGQQQIAEETRFCSRCGLLLTGIAQVAANDGILPQNFNSDEFTNNSPRKKGIKHGAFFILLSLLMIPILIAISVTLRIAPPLTIIFAFLTIGGGILRIIYALMFESNFQAGKTLEEKAIDSAQNLFNSKKNQKVLSAQQSIPVSVYAPPNQGNWRDTNDLDQPSVIENTTKLLEQEEK